MTLPSQHGFVRRSLRVPTGRTLKRRVADPVVIEERRYAAPPVNWKLERLPSSTAPVEATQICALALVATRAMTKITGRNSRLHPSHALRSDIDIMFSFGAMCRYLHVDETLTIHLLSFNTNREKMNDLCCQKTV